MTQPIGAAQARRARALRVRLIVAVIFTIAVMVVSMVPGLHFAHWGWLAAVLAAPVVLWCAWPFHVQAVRGLIHASFTMNTLVSLGIVASVAWSLYALFAGGHLYFDGAVMITTFLLAGRLAEARARYSAGDALRALVQVGATKARRVVTSAAGTETIAEVPVQRVEVGDLLVVAPGQKVPTDGRVVAGRAAVDTAALTGESLPVTVQAGDSVAAGTVVTDGTLRMRAEAVGADTMLAQIGQMVTQAQAGKAPVQRLADRVASVFVPVVLGIAVLTFIGWLVGGAGVTTAFTNAVAVLVVACPCALGLATPTAMLVGSGRAAQLGIVIRGPEILEGSRTLDSVVLDKTGTLTEGRLEVAETLPAQDATAAPAGTVDPEAAVAKAPAVAADDPGVATRPQPSAPGAVPEANSPADDPVAHLLQLAGRAEAGSEHPVARALAHAAGATATPERFGNHPGMGVHAVVGGTLVLAGRLSWLRDLGVHVPDDALERAHRLQDTGATIVAVATATEREQTLDEGGDEDADTTGENANPQVSAASDAAEHTLDLAIEGMTCASCVNRVERALSSVDQVDASVNLATDSAHCTSGAGIDADALIAAVQAAGYDARVSQSPASGAHKPARERRADTLAPLATSTYRGLIALRDTLRPTSAHAIAELRQMGITAHLATGDNEGAAQRVAQQVGIEHVLAHATPAAKRDLVIKLQSAGEHVGMVGDGVNDAAALAQAGYRGLGFAMGQGTDVAIEAADIILMRPDVRLLVTAIRVGRTTLRVIKQNLGWAFGYNVIAIPVAAAGLLNPMIASGFMAISSVLVVGNSLRLRRMS